ncbi:MAG: MFS transporter [Armatimonadetes bacterium]|nr:MFS transporter [Armatimonadota bacterium]
MAHQEGGFDRRKLAVITLGHFLNDFHVSFLAPLLPLIVTKFQLSLALAGFLATVQSASAAMSQPLFGVIADRLPRCIFIALGPTLTMAAMGLFGLAPSYQTLLVLLLIAGLGTAIFHPQGAGMAGTVARARRGLGISIFIAAGEMGFALGPVTIATLVAWRGLGATIYAVVPGLVLVLFVWRAALAWPPTPTAGARGLGADLRPHLWPLFVIWVIVVMRNIVSSAFMTFLPLVLRERGASVVAGGAALFLYAGVGALGGLSGGYLTDRLGRRGVLVASFLVGAPLLWGFLWLRGPLSFLFLALGGMAYFASATVSLVMAQELLPGRASMASSIVMGLAWGVGGLMMTPIGAIADVAGLTTALAGAVAVALLPAVGILAVPSLVPSAARPVGERARA